MASEGLQYLKLGSSLLALIFLHQMVFCEDKCEHRLVCEETKACQMSYNYTWENIPQKNITSTWVKNNESVSTCMGGKCKTVPLYKNWVISQSFMKDNALVHALKFISKAIILDGSLWYFMSNDIVLCNWKVHIYRKPVNVSCHIEVKLDETPWLTCGVHKAYPNFSCIFLDNLLQGHDRKFDVEYNYDPTDTSYCSTKLNATREEYHHYKFSVTVFPNILNSFHDVSYGLNMNIVFQIGSPKVTFTCEEKVREGELFSCRCFKSDSSNLTTLVQWFQNEKVLLSGRNEAVLVHKANINNTGFVCSGSNDLGWESQKLVYMPDILGLVDFQTYVCPNKSQHICGYHGECFSNDEFCTKDKKVESCFPSNITDLFHWCGEKGQFNVSLMRDTSCQHACVTRFGRYALITYTQVPHDENKHLMLISIVISVSILMLIILNGFSCMRWITELKAKYTRPKHLAYMDDCHEDIQTASHDYEEYEYIPQQNAIKERKKEEQLFIDFLKRT